MKLNAKQMAAAAAGASPAVIASLADPVEVTATAPAAVIVATTATAPIVTNTAAPTVPEVTAPVVADAPVTTPVAAVAPVTTIDASVHTAVVAQLNSQLNAAQAALVTAQVEASTFKASAAQVEPLLKIAQAALGNRLVALGASTEAASTFSAANITAEFDRVDAQFKEKFKVGGVAATNAPVSASASPAIDPMLQASQAFFIPQK